MMVTGKRSFVAFLLLSSTISSIVFLSFMQFRYHHDVFTEPHEHEHFVFPQSHCLQHNGNCTSIETPSSRDKVTLLGNGSALYGRLSEKTLVPSKVPQGNLDAYHNWELFHADFNAMLHTFKVYVYPDAYDTKYNYSKVFLPHGNPLDPKLGNYFSEHMFKIILLNSTFLTLNPEEAHLFFLPFSINVLRNDPRIKEEKSIANFVAQYVKKINSQFEFWNRTQGGDHFYVCCHSVGKNVASEVPSLWRNSIQVVCSSSYYHKLYIAHKDVAMPQIWPRTSELSITPPHKRTKLAFYAGRTQNSKVRARLLDAWKNDTDMDIYSERIHGSYEDAFRKSKFCLHVKGYEVNTARIADAIHFGCVPVIISDHYDLPFANVLDWKKFSIIVSHADISSLKSILQSVSYGDYQKLHKNVCQIRPHFEWEVLASKLDAFHMTMYQLWLRRNLVRPSILSQEWTSNSRSFSKSWTDSS